MFWDATREEFQSHANTLDDDRRDRYHDLIDLYIRMTAHYGYDSTDYPAMIRESYPELLELDPDPPLIVQTRYYISAFDHSTSDPTDPSIIAHANALVDIAERLEGQRAHDYFIAQAYSAALDYYRRSASSDPDRVRLASERLKSHLLDATVLDNVDPRFWEYTLYRLNFYVRSYSGWTSQEKADYIDTLLEHPNADPFIVQALAGYQKRTLAWEIRGTGFANTVQAEAWPRFHELMGQAYAHFKAAWELRPDCGIIYEQLIDIAGATNTPDGLDMRFWFDQMLEHRPSYIYGWDSFIHYSRPRWGGSIHEMMSIQIEAAHVAKELPDEERREFAYIFYNLTGACLREDKSTGISSSAWTPIHLECVRAELQSPMGWRSQSTRNAMLRSASNDAFRYEHYELARELLLNGGADVEKGWRSIPEFPYERWSKPILMSPYWELGAQMFSAMEAGDKERALPLAASLIAELESAIELNPEDTRLPLAIESARKFERSISRN
jgi:tetratricopeptide (TPR) repeat protein